MVDVFLRQSSFRNREESGASIQKGARPDGVLRREAGRLVTGVLGAGETIPKAARWGKGGVSTVSGEKV